MATIEYTVTHEWQEVTEVGTDIDFDMANLSPSKDLLYAFAASTPAADFQGMLCKQRMTVPRGGTGKLYIRSRAEGVTFTASISPWTE